MDMHKFDGPLHNFRPLTQGNTLTEICRVCGDPENGPLHKTVAARSDILAEAEKCITQDRAKTYGSAEDNFRAIADLWNWWFKGRLCIGGPITPHDVSTMMALLKVARIRGNPGHRDSYVDLCGYAALAGELGVDPVDPS